MGVTTWNRSTYLRRFIETFEETKSDAYRWTLIVADDGSTDETWGYLLGREPVGYEMVVIRNHGLRIAGQTNTILKAASALTFDFGFKADDDVYFNAPGWDDLYYEAATSTGVDHLVYHNANWKPGSHDIDDGRLSSRVSAIDSMGCFYTFTPRVLTNVGYFDELNFPVRGHSHIDFTMRCCRQGFNDETTLWDARFSDQYVGMWGKETYEDLTDWASPEIQRVTSDSETERRWGVVGDATRRYLEIDEASAIRTRVYAIPVPPNIDTTRRLEASGTFTVPGPINEDFDGVYVLNLADDQRKWSDTCEQLVAADIAFERFPAVFGGAKENLRAWRHYFERGLTHPVERRLNRKLIQSPGAWGYLLTMRELLIRVQSERRRRILVFDDDIRVHKDFRTMYEQLRTDIGSRPTVLFLGGTQRSWDGVVQAGNHAYQPNEKLDGSFAVGIDATAFQALIDGINEFTWPFDAGPLRQVALENVETSFVASPSLVIPDVGHSYIREARSMDELASLANWKLHDYLERSPPRPRRNQSDERITALILCNRSHVDVLDTILSIRHQDYAKLDIYIGVGTNPRSTKIAEIAANQDSRVSVFSSDIDFDDLDILNSMLEHVTSDFVVAVAPGTVSVRDRFSRAIAALNQDGGDVVTSRSVSTVVLPPGTRNTREDFEDWGAEFETGQTYATVDAIRMKVLDAYGGLIVTGHNTFKEVVDRSKAAGHKLHQIELDRKSALTTNDQVDDEPWAEFHRMISMGDVPSFMVRAGDYKKLSVYRVGDSHADTSKPT